MLSTAECTLEQLAHPGVVEALVRLKGIGEFEVALDIIHSSVSPDGTFIASMMRDGTLMVLHRGDAQAMDVTCYPLLQTSWQDSCAVCITNNKQEVYVVVMDKHGKFHVLSHDTNRWIEEKLVGPTLGGHCLYVRDRTYALVSRMQSDLEAFGLMYRGDPNPRYHLYRERRLFGGHYWKFKKNECNDG